MLKDVDVIRGKAIAIEQKLRDVQTEREHTKSREKQLSYTDFKTTKRDEVIQKSKKHKKMVRAYRKLDRHVHVQVLARVNPCERTFRHAFCVRLVRSKSSTI